MLDILWTKWETLGMVEISRSPQTFHLCFYGSTETRKMFSVF